MTLAIATRPLVVQRDGERVAVNPGEVIPDFDSWADAAQTAVVEAERVETITDPAVIAEAVRLSPEYRDDLFAALKAEGYKVTKAKAEA